MVGNLPLAVILDKVDFFLHISSHCVFLFLFSFTVALLRLINPQQQLPHPITASASRKAAYPAQTSAPRPTHRSDPGNRLKRAPDQPVPLGTASTISDILPASSN